jgi:hypothetical protein
MWHLVLVKAHRDLSLTDRRALADAFACACRNIPTVRDVRVGRRVTHGAGYEVVMADMADFIVTLVFDDLAGLQAYLQHPAHQDLSRRFTQSCSSALVYDFDVGGIETLSKLVECA